MDNHITISLKDNQSYDNAYSLVYDDEATDEKEIPESTLYRASAACMGDIC